MSSYHIEIEVSAAKELSKLDRPTQRRIQSAIVALATDPRPHGCTKLSGTRDAYRIRIGDYRVVYSVTDAIRVVTITRIAHRRNVYRR